MNNNELQGMVEKLSAMLSINTKSVLTADETARYMGVKKSYLYKLTMQKMLPFSKPFGKTLYFSRLEVEAWLMSNRVATADEIRDQAQAYCARAHKNNKGGTR